MLRPVSLLPALVVAVATLLTGFGPPAAAAASGASAKPAATPLTLTIDTLSPSTVPSRGPIRISGSVTNRDDGDWRDINVYAFLGDQPITTVTGLADAAQTPAESEVGGRIIDLGDPRTEAKIDKLAPGETAQFSLTVPHHDIKVTESGVYWFGVHALGAGPEGRVDGADGRARTFMPLVPKTNKTVDTSLVIPVRRLVTHAADGSLDSLARWTRDLSQGGSLRSLVDLGAAAGTRPVSWLVDPSIVDTARRLAAGNPPRSLEPTTDTGQGNGGGGDGGGSSESPSPDESPSPSASESADPDAGGHEPTQAESDAASAATSWLERLHEGLDGNEILALPYGDVDVAAAAEHDPQVLRRARKRSDGDLQPWGLPTVPAVSSPKGFLDATGIRATDPRDTLLVTDRMFGARAPAVAHTAGRTLGVTSSGAISGGPGPNARMTPLEVRQRIVSEAALRLLTPGRKPLIAVFPTTWSPSPATGFWDGLDLSWLNLTTVQSALQRTGTDVDVDRLDYPPNQRKLELDPSSFTAADDLVRAGDTLQNLLTQNDQVGTEVRDEALTDLSYSNRLRPETGRASAVQSRSWIDRRLVGVTVDAPKAVILSSGSGKFAATVNNTLDQPVSVRIQAVADEPLEVSVPKETIDLGPESRTTVLLNASSSAIGVRTVTLSLTDSDGVSLGSTDAVPIRSNRVSNVIWLIIGTGVALLFGAIVVRLFRRVRTARRAS